MGNFTRFVPLDLSGHDELASVDKERVIWKAIQGNLWHYEKCVTLVKVGFLYLCPVFALYKDWRAEFCCGNTHMTILGCYTVWRHRFSLQTEFPAACWYLHDTIGGGNINGVWGQIYNLCHLLDFFFLLCLIERYKGKHNSIICKHLYHFFLKKSPRKEIPRRGSFTSHNFLWPDYDIQGIGRRFCCAENSAVHVALTALSMRCLTFAIPRVISSAWGKCGGNNGNGEKYFFHGGRRFFCEWQRYGYFCYPQAFVKVFFFIFERYIYNPHQSFRIWQFGI